MKIGYPCINWTIGCKGDRRFRLNSYSEKRLIDTARNNLDCLLQILRFNVQHGILFFRITSDLIPFASHAVCQFDWLSHFRREFEEIGSYINLHDIRISMHPGQFTLLNTPDDSVLENSTRELLYHAQVLDAMALDSTAKIQLHVGGVYGDKGKGILRFIERYKSLDEQIKNRLVIENDDRNYSLTDCLRIHAEIGIPVLFDVLHHELNNSGEGLKDAFALFTKTWEEEDGIPMVDYSQRRTAGLNIRHSESIDVEQFKRFLEQTRPFNYDVMLEIKDKEKSALRALPILVSDPRFYSTSRV
jgi:UV DNA damage endonuclease